MTHNENRAGWFKEGAIALSGKLLKIKSVMNIEQCLFLSGPVVHSCAGVPEIKILEPHNRQQFIHFLILICCVRNHRLAVM